MLRSCCLVLVVVASVTGLGCRASVQTRPAEYEVTYADVPTDIEVYPHTYYEGRPVYLYQSRWYYRDGGRWTYYRDEPPSLGEYRQRHYVQEAPPAPRGYPPGGGTYNNGPSSAPPAVRTR